MDRIELMETLEVMLAEDVGSGDVTSAFCPNRRVKAEVSSNSKGYVSGVEEALILLAKHKIKARAHVRDGGAVRPGQIVFSLAGNSRDILHVERTVLNIMSRMSGITTLTRCYADAMRKSGSKAKVAATRKTAPGLMRLDKKAVRLGGGLTHRMGLYDMVLLKDNHLALFGNDVMAAVEAAKKAKTGKRIEVEVSSVEDALAAASAGAEIIMFDNMRQAEIAGAVALLAAAKLRRKVLLEASGGVTLENIGKYGKTGVDWVSVGRLTNSAPALDFTLHILK